jgi:signal transduction histidine kinase
MKPVSIRTRVAAASFCLLALVMTVALAITLTAYKRGADELLTQGEHSRLDIAAVFARDALLTRDYAPLQPRLVALAANPDVNAAMLIDERGTVVASSDPALVGAPPPPLVADSGHEWTIHDVDDATGATGRLAVDFSTELRDTLDTTVRTQAIIAGVLGTLLCATISLLAAQLLTQRLGSIVQAARRISDGDLSARAGVQGDDEIGTLGSAFDRMVERLTETQRELSAHKADLESLVEQRTAELRDAQAGLLERERLATMGQIIASVSHELLNPLGTISASLHVISESTDRDPETIARAVARTRRNIDRCVRIIDDLGDYSAELTPQATRFELSGLLRSVGGELTPPDAVQLHIQPAPDIWLRADPQLLRKAVSHLLRNACQASEAAGDAAAGPISLTCCRHDDEVRITVSDRAGGIPDDELEQVFAPLYSTRAFGSGLGLTIARRIVERHGGRLDLRSRSGTGVDVTIVLPAG